MMRCIVSITLIGLTALVMADNRQPTLDERVRLLQENLLKRPTMSMNVDRWKTYVQTSPRNYSIIAMFTVLSPNMNCPICKPAYEEFMILANSYRYTHLQSKNLYFVIVDYEEAPQIFQQARFPIVLGYSLISMFS